MTAADGVPDLTDEQRAVVEQPAESPLLVTAGPGSGKTHTLIRRIDFLVTEEGLAPEEIQVLTFSRAATLELRTRLARTSGSARNVRAQTFDAWALALLSEIEPDREWEERRFEERIDQACRAIEDGRAGSVIDTGLSHLLVDEVQDLTDSRRNLVEALIDVHLPGFTLVGDPAQSIYSFTVQDRSVAAQEAGRFFTWVRRSFSDDLVELALTHNFRAATDEARTALAHGPALQTATVSGASRGRELYEELHGTLLGVLDLELDSFGYAALGEHEGTTAILCRYNHQALHLSETLWAEGVEHILRGPAQERRPSPPWLAVLFHEVDGVLLRRARFVELLGAETHTGVDDLSRLWHGLCRSTGSRPSSKTIDLQRLRRELTRGTLAEEIITRPRPNLVVSSFHRAKGLEFDRVVVVDPGPLSRSGGSEPVDHAEEARLLYVAMTRTREQLLRLCPPRLPGVRKTGRRWGRFSLRKSEGWKRLGLEVTGEDVDTSRPGGTVPLDQDPVGVQKHLLTHVRPGDPVTLERLHPSTDRVGQSPPYAIVHQGRPVGVVSEHFRRDLHHFLKLSSTYEPRNWPRTLNNIRVDALESVAGSTASGARAGLGPHGVWLAPRLTGLSRFDYGNTTEKGPQ